MIKINLINLINKIKVKIKNYLINKIKVKIKNLI